MPSRGSQAVDGVYPQAIGGSETSLCRGMAGRRGNLSLGAGRCSHNYLGRNDIGHNYLSHGAGRPL